MSGVFRNIDPPHPLTAWRVRGLCGRRTHSLGGEGVGVGEEEGEGVGGVNSS
jgi:hypothetical protein